MTRNSWTATQATRGLQLRCAQVRRLAPYFAGIFYLLTCCLVSRPAVAQVAAPVQGAPGASPASCVDVAINDHSALSYDCLNRRLMMTHAGPPRQAIDADAVTREPGNRQVGQYNFSALSHRMGANLGRSVIPQRPPPPPPRVVLPASFGTH